jgi:hypothetical protein
VIFDFRLIVEGQRFTRQCAGYDYQALHDDLNFAHVLEQLVDALETDEVIAYP